GGAVRHATPRGRRRTERTLARRRPQRFAAFDEARFPDQSLNLVDSFSFGRYFAPRAADRSKCPFSQHSRVSPASIARSVMPPIVCLRAFAPVPLFTTAGMWAILYF